MENLICPHCESKNVIEDDCYDVEVSHYHGYVVMRKSGHCEDCKRLLGWEIWYDLLNPSVRDMTAYESCYEEEEEEE